MPVGSPDQDEQLEGPEAAADDSDDGAGVFLDGDLSDLPVGSPDQDEQLEGSVGSASSSAGSSSSDSAASSSSSGSSTDDPEASGGEDAPEPALPRGRKRHREQSLNDLEPSTRVRRAETFEWRGFRFTFKPPNESGRSSYMVLCRYHSKAGDSTKCTRTAGWTSEDQRDEVVRRLKTWCIHAPSFSDRNRHQGLDRNVEAMTDEELTSAVLPPLP